MELPELRDATRDVLVNLALTSTAPAGRVDTSISTGKPGSHAPRSEDSAAAPFAAAAQDAWNDAERLAGVLDRARAALRQIKFSEAPEIRSESWPELAARIVSVGENWTAVEVAQGLRTSARLVRRARLAAGRDPENGFALPPEIANGKPVKFATHLVLSGYSIRAAAMLAGVPRSSVHDAVRTTRAG